MSRFDLPVSEYMTSPVITIGGAALLADAERSLADHAVSSLAVVGAYGLLEGVISRTDLLRVGRLRAAMASDRTLLTLPRLPVRDRMVTEVVCADPDMPVWEAATRMSQRHIHRLFVVEEGRPVGVLSTRDIIRSVVDERVVLPVGDLISRPVLAIEATAAVADATDRLDRSRVRGLIVIDSGWPVGIFTQSEALASRSLPPGTAVEEVMSAALLCLPQALPLFRAARFALATRARRILAVESRQMRGVLTGLDFARLAAGRR